MKHAAYIIGLAAILYFDYVFVGAVARDVASGRAVVGVFYFALVCAAMFVVSWTHIFYDVF